jgi:glycosyltransferase involved in cell wall biosynthesis
VTTATTPAGAADGAVVPAPRPLLSVVVPVFNGGDEIVGNVGEIRRAAAGGLEPEDVEIVVVSDGSLDGTAERLLAARSDVDMRVIHYDRNLGKGYAVKLGTLASHGDWIALVDADLDLDPEAVPGFLEIARREGLDFAIGSKRHPDSVVDYPRSRRAMSWCYQQLNRILFGLDVRDTQVGLKVLSRAVADEVVPLLIVKRYVFDLELLAVAHALGRGRVRELPIRLSYRFSGSGVGWRAVARALFDTAAVFYRLRLLRTYQRKRSLVGPVVRPEQLPVVSLAGASEIAGALDYPCLEVESGRGELLAVLAPGSRPAGNWVTAAVPYFARPEVAAVVVPTLAPPDASVREQAAAAVLESRLGGGSRRSVYFPGNVRVVSDYAASSVVVRRRDREEASRAGIGADRLVAWLAEHGRLTVYTPDSMIVSAPAPLFRPHLRATLAYARARGAAARQTGGRSISVATTLSLAPAALALAGLAFTAAGSPAGAALAAVYVAAVGGAAALVWIRSRSARVALLALPGLVATQAAYVAGFLQGLAGGR